MKSCCAILQRFTLKSINTRTSTLLIIIFLIFSLDSFAQEIESPVPHAPATTEQQNDPNPKTDWSKKFYTGGGLGLQFGSYTYIELSPILGYHITPKFSAGIGATYIYLRDRANNFSTSIYGGKVFAEYDVYRGISPHVEYELLNLEVYGVFLRQRVYVSSLLVGGSYHQEVGTNSTIYIMLLYNLIDDIYSPYENPILRIGFNVGF